MSFEFDFESEAFKKDPKAAVTAAVNEHVAGLVAKRDELLGKNKALQTERDALKTQVGELEQFKTEAEDKGVGKNPELEATIKRLERELAKSNKERDDAVGGATQYRTEVELNKALDQIGVLPELREAVTAMFKGQVKVGPDGCQLSDKPVGDFLQEWSKSDKGRVFVKAADNGGGGGNGGRNSNAGVVNPWAKETENLTKQAEMLKTNPQLAAQMQAAAAPKA